MAMCVISASDLQVMQHSAEEKAIAEKSDGTDFSRAAGKAARDLPPFGGIERLAPHEKP
jgi:hypothetical protein